MMDAINITQDRIARSRLAGDPPDITIGPRRAVSACSISTVPAKRSSSARKAAEKQIEEIKHRRKGAGRLALIRKSCDFSDKIMLK